MIHIEDLKMMNTHKKNDDCGTMIQFSSIDDHYSFEPQTGKEEIPEEKRNR
jgi:hypothetical protein